MTISLDPIRLFQSANNTSDKMTVMCTPIVLTVGNNRQLVAAVTDSIIEVVGWNAQAVAGAVGAFALKSASGGTFLTTPKTVPPVTAGISDKMPIAFSTYGIRTIVSQGLYADITGADINFDLFWIKYTP
jgi:hypothetical protein